MMEFTYVLKNSFDEVIGQWDRIPEDLAVFVGGIGTGVKALVNGGDVRIRQSKDQETLYFIAGDYRYTLQIDTYDWSDDSDGCLAITRYELVKAFEVSKTKFVKDAPDYETIAKTVIGDGLKCRSRFTTFDFRAKEEIC